MSSGVALIEGKVKRHDGVRDILVGLLAGQAEIEYYPDLIDPAGVAALVGNAGFHAELMSRSNDAVLVLLYDGHDDERTRGKVEGSAKGKHQVYSPYALGGGVFGGGGGFPVVKRGDVLWDTMTSTSICPTFLRSRAPTPSPQSAVPLGLHPALHHNCPPSSTITNHQPSPLLDALRADWRAFGALLRPNRRFVVSKLGLQASPHLLPHPPTIRITHCVAYKSALCCVQFEVAGIASPTPPRTHPPYLVYSMC